MRRIPADPEQSLPREAAVEINTSCFLWREEVLPSLSPYRWIHRQRAGRKAGREEEEEKETEEGGEAGQTKGGRYDRVQQFLVVLFGLF